MVNSLDPFCRLAQVSMSTRRVGTKPTKHGNTKQPPYLWSIWDKSDFLGLVTHDLAHSEVDGAMLALIAASSAALQPYAVHTPSRGHISGICLSQPSLSRKSSKHVAWKHVAGQENSSHDSDAVCWRVVFEGKTEGFRVEYLGALWLLETLETGRLSKALASVTCRCTSSWSCLGVLPFLIQAMLTALIWHRAIWDQFDTLDVTCDPRISHLWAHQTGHFGALCLQHLMVQITAFFEPDKQTVSMSCPRGTSWEVARGQLNVKFAGVECRIFSGALKIFDGGSWRINRTDHPPLKIY